MKLVPGTIDEMTLAVSVAKIGKEVCCIVDQEHYWEAKGRIEILKTHAPFPEPTEVYMLVTVADYYKYYKEYLKKSNMLVLALPDIYEQIKEIEG